MNVLQRLEEITLTPFPHVVIENALPDELYQELVNTWPVKQRQDGNNAVSLARGHKLMDRKELPRVWRDFITYHQSSEFFRLVNDKFNLGLAGRVLPRKRTADIGMECQLGTTSPVTIPCSVKGPHWDNPRTKWAGLLYFRDPQDLAGGDLELYDVPRPKFHKDRFTCNHGRPFRTIPYAANTFVGWVNSPISIHGVTPRQVTNIPRRYVNFTVDA